MCTVRNYCATFTGSQSAKTTIFRSIPSLFGRSYRENENRTLSTWWGVWDPFEVGSGHKKYAEHVGHIYSWIAPRQVGPKLEKVKHLIFVFNQLSHLPSYQIKYENSSFLVITKHDVKNQQSGFQL